MFLNYLIKVIKFILKTISLLSFFLEFFPILKVNQEVDPLDDKHSQLFFYMSDTLTM